MKQVINGKTYNTKTANLVASNNYWDGRNIYLYKTNKGNFFLHHTTRWQGERDRIEAITKTEAKSWFKNLLEAGMEYEEAFGIDECTYPDGNFVSVEDGELIGEVKK